MSKTMKDPIGDRMKDFYEDRTRYKLQRKSYTILRIDGKAFHSYTKGLTKPFDKDLIDDMNYTAKYLCENIMGAKLAYVQSDEISIVVTDFDEIETQAWFDNNLQKMCSVSSSLATEQFNRIRLKRKIESTASHIDQVQEIIDSMKRANFDSRVFQIPFRNEVINYLIWRQQDAIRNSISSVAQSMFSHKQLEGKKTSQMIEMIKERNKEQLLYGDKAKLVFDWEDFPIGCQRGRLIVKENFETINNVIRTRWVVKDPEIFSKNQSQLNVIP